MSEEINVDVSTVAIVPKGNDFVEERVLYGVGYKPALLTLRVVELPDSSFIRDGYNMVTKILVDFVESLSCFDKAIQMPDNRALRIKKLSTTQDKEKLILKGWGLPYKEDGVYKFGDLIVFCRIVPPPPNFYRRTSTQFMLNALEPSPPTPNLDEMETTQLVSYIRFTKIIF